VSGLPVTRAESVTARASSVNTGRPGRLLVTDAGPRAVQLCVKAAVGRTRRMPRRGELNLIDSSYKLTAMYRIVNFGVVLILICGHALRAASPEDIAFRARLVKGTHVYHMGEPIEIE